MIDVSGSFTLGHGTGKFAGISGHGRYTLSIMDIAARSNGACSLATRPTAFQQILPAQGPVHLPGR
jgi:hypothetical protein